MSDKLSERVHLTDDGVVIFPGGWMHPFSFRDLMGEEMFQELLSRPRVPSLYPEEGEEEIEKSS